MKVQMEKPDPAAEEREFRLRMLAKPNSLESYRRSVGNWVVAILAIIGVLAYFIERN